MRQGGQGKGGVGGIKQRRQTVNPRPLPGAQRQIKPPVAVAPHRDARAHHPQALRAQRALQNAGRVNGHLGFGQGQKGFAIGLQQAQILQLQPGHPVGAQGDLNGPDRQRPVGQRALHRAVETVFNLGHGPDRQGQRFAPHGKGPCDQTKDDQQQDQPPAQPGALGAGFCGGSGPGRRQGWGWGRVHHPLIRVQHHRGSTPRRLRACGF